MKLSIILVVYIFLQFTDSFDIVITPPGEKFVKPVGSASLFTCSISTEEEEIEHISIHWYDNSGVEIQELSGRRFVEDDDDHTKLLYITSIDASDAGQFTCKVNLGDKQLEKSISLDIFHDLKIVANETQNPIFNSDALISCLVSGDPNYKVSWKKDGKRLLGSRFVIDSKKGLTIEKITEADNGVYMCRADVRKLGVVRSKNINVVVHTPPKISLEHNTVEILLSEKAILKCHATGFPKPTFSFTKVGSDEVLEHDDENLLIDEEEGILEFPVVQREDEGAYACTASNDAGTDTASIVLTVLVAPKILKFLPAEATSGEALDLKCVVIGNPLPKVKISKTDPSDNKGGDEVYLNEHSSYIFPRFITYEAEAENEATSLSIHPVKPEDAGKYMCSANNSVGQDALETHVSVKYIPIMNKNLVDFEYNWLGHSVNFSCEASGLPSPTYSWAKFESDENISNNKTYTIFDIGSKSILQVNVGEHDEDWVYGIYHCIATNDLGEVAQDFEMKQAVVPDKPMHVSLVEAHPSMIMIEISPPETDGGVPVIAYVVEYRKYIEETPAEAEKSADEASELHKSEEDGADGENENEPGDDSKFESNEHDAISEEDDSDHSNKDDDTAMMMNDAPVADDDQDNWIKVAESEDLKVSVSDLEPETEYQFRIRAKNAVGYGRPSFFKAKTTSQNVPSMIELSSSSQCQQPFTYKASWKAPYDGGLPINSYVVKYKLSKEGLNLTAVNPKLLGWSEKQTKETFIELSDLRAQSTYLLQVHARNSLGLSPVHDEFIFKTCKDPIQVIQTNIEVRKPELSASTEQSSKKGVVIGVVIAVILFLAIIVDIICCCTKKRGLFFMCCFCLRGDSQKNKTQGSKMSPSNENQELEEQRYLAAEKKV